MNDTIAKNTETNGGFNCEDRIRFIRIWYSLLDSLMTWNHALNGYRNLNWMMENTTSLNGNYRNPSGLGL